jgi:hypothetical protein
VSSGRGITDLERLTRPGGKVLPDDETIPVLTERLVLPSLELDTSLPALATTDTIVPDVTTAEATGADSAPIGGTAPDDEVANTAFPMPAPAAVDVEAMLPLSGAPFVAATPPAPVAHKAVPEPEAAPEPEATVAPADSSDPEMALEAEAIVEPEPIIEREASVEPDLIIEPDSIVEPEPTIEREAIAAPDLIIEPDSIVEPGPITERTPNVPPEAAFEPATLATPTATGAPETTVATGMTLATAATIDWAEVEESARDALLRELQLRLASELDRHLRERLQPTLVRMLLATVTELRPSIEAAVREAVTRAVAAEIARQRSGD